MRVPQAGAQRQQSRSPAGVSGEVQGRLHRGDRWELGGEG